MIRFSRKPSEPQSIRVFAQKQTLAILLFFSSLPTFGGDPIRSKIDFTDVKHPNVIYANISDADPFEGACPLDKLPEGMKNAADQLVAKIRESVGKIKIARSGNCNQLKTDMANSETQLKSALTNQMIAANPGTANASQDLINATTQKATALNQLVLTISTLSQSQCISSNDDKISLQRLLGQVITFSGLMYGSWPGLATAMGGQIAGNLPLFRERADRALELFQKYDEKMEIREFLCLFRQMQKTECLMFSDPNISVINGVDLSFKSGPTYTTRESIRKLETEVPHTLRDIQLLGAVNEKMKEFSDQGRGYNLQSEGPVSNENLKNLPGLNALDELKNGCEQIEWRSLEDPLKFPERIKTSLAAIQDTCAHLHDLDYLTLLQASPVATLVGRSYWQIRILREYYRSLQNDLFSPLGKIAATWESIKYFESYIQSVTKARDPSQGSQDRLNFKDLVDGLRTRLGKYYLRIMMRDNSKKLDKRGFLFHKTSFATSIQREALKSMISVCQTLDPTLACLYADTPDQEKLNQRWLARCVGPESDLCKKLGKKLQGRNNTEIQTLISDPVRWTYLRSLCNIL